MTLGPFDLTPDQVVRLGNGFSEFVNLLLEAERRDQDLAGHLLTITSNETTADGGVDARLLSAQATTWLPGGDSFWQFKRANIGPTKCGTEIAGATWAKECIKHGGSYVMVMGADLNARAQEARRKKIVEHLVADGVVAADDRSRIRVYGAVELARWASRFPSLAVSRLAGGPGTAAVDFDSWAAFQASLPTWTPDTSREQAVDSIRSALRSSELRELRIQGESGRGKTRLVLEALRDAGFRPLVGYIADEREFGNELLNYLLSAERSAILVVDECSAERHIKISDRLPADQRIRLVTIGESGAGGPMKAPVIEIDALPGEQLEEFLKQDYPVLRPEARRFVIEHGHGNIRMAIVLAERVRNLNDGDAADIISRNDVQALLAAALPSGADFFVASALALFERIGWDRELRPQLELLADFAETSVERLLEVGNAMEHDGLLVAHGRLRAVEPHPLAVVLASECWRTHGQRIIDSLLPRLDEQLLLSLFRRVADLGRFKPATSVLPRLLAPNAPFGSLRSIAGSRLGPALTQLAIVLPDEVMAHLRYLIESESADALRRQTAGRRDLVWTLEKLAWHTRTFEAAADALLRLALAENETWANNATGTWLALFPTWLPATAARPDQRQTYLLGHSKSPDAAIRLLVARAAKTTLQVHQSTMVSAELQGGVLVEPRGQPATYDEAWSYQRGAISLLAELRGDPDESVRREAETALLEALRPFIGAESIGPKLSEVLLEFRGESLERLRSDIADALRLEALVDPKPEGRLFPPMIEELRALERQLPTPTPTESLRLLLQARRWEFADTDLQQRVDDAVSEMASAGHLEDALALVAEAPTASGELGRAIGRQHSSDHALDLMIASFSVNPAALTGYLDGLVDIGHESAYDDLLASDKLAHLDQQTKLAVAVRGPVTSASRRRVVEGVGGLSVGAGTSLLFGWRQHLTEGEIADRLDDWLTRVESQQEYSSLLEWVHSFLYDRKPLPTELKLRLHALVTLRRRFPAQTNYGYVWSQLAQLDIPEHAAEIFRLLLDLNDDDSDFMIHQDTYDSEVLLRSATSRPEITWADLGARLQSGSWRTTLVVRGWLTAAFSLSIIAAWIGDDVERARLVAEIAAVGEDKPTELARFLFGEFGDDDRVRSSLAGDFISGFWTGPESARIDDQIAKLRAWVADETQPDGLRRWAKEMIAGLEQRRADVLEREAEEPFR